MSDEIKFLYMWVLYNGETIDDLNERIDRAQYTINMPNDFTFGMSGNLKHYSCVSNKVKDIICCKEKAS